jgi:hypothetical protein
MKLSSIIRLTIILAIIPVLLVSCGGGGGGGGGSILRGYIVGETGAPLKGGQYLVQGTIEIGTIGQDGAFAVPLSASKGILILVNLSPEFRFRRIPFDTTGTGGTNLGNVTLPADALSKGWGAYRAGNFATAETRFSEHINASGRDSGEAENGLGWARARVGDADDAITSLVSALGEGFDADVRSALAAAYIERTAHGDYSIPEAISSLDLAIGEAGFYISQPLHDNISDDDLMAFRAILNLLDGRTSAAMADRSTLQNKADPRLNSASEDILVVVDFFLGN